MKSSSTYKFTIINDHDDVSDQYGQVGQSNPLRYQFAQRSKRELRLKGAPMSCRDFFNDAVASYHGYTKRHYGYDTTQIKFNRYGLYVYYTNVTNPEQFIQNIEQAINPQLLKDTGSKVVCHAHDKSSVVVRIPTAVLKYTWRMSLLTQLIRNSNYGVSYDSWDSLFKNWPVTERTFDTSTKKLCKKQGFKPLFEAWWYSNRLYNGNTLPDGVSMSDFLSSIHGNGCNTITNAAIRENLIKA